MNPLRLDPTRTTLLRQRYVREIRARFGNLKRKIVHLITTEDALGLKPKPATPFTFNERWKYLPPADQVEAFKAWLQDQIDRDILGEANFSDQPWMYHYTTEAYKQGVTRAFQDARQFNSGKESEDFYRGGRDQFLRSTFYRPVSRQRIELLAGRSYTEMEGITDAMSQKMTGVLVDGMLQGLNPREVAQNLITQVDGIGQNRAFTLAHTETIRAHNEGNLYALEDMGVEEIGVMVEWSTAGFNVCSKCKDLEGIVIPISAAHGMFPRHPHCRCMPRPANVGESTKGQIRDPAKVEAAIKKSTKGETKQQSAYWYGSRMSLKKKVRS